MSNPAVVILASCTLEDRETLRIEDNIGEAIHVHLGSLRFDLNIEQFVCLGHLFENALNALIQADGFNSKAYDPTFLRAVGEGLLDLERVQTDAEMLSRLKVYIDLPLGVVRCVPLPKSRVVQALAGDTTALDRYVQSNAFEETNRRRLEAIAESVRTRGYTLDLGAIVLFNRQNIIRDGQHRCGVLWSDRGDIKVEVHRWLFRDGRHAISETPLLATIVRVPMHLVRSTTSFMAKCARRIGGRILRRLGLRR